MGWWCTKYAIHHVEVVAGLFLGSDRGNMVFLYVKCHLSLFRAWIHLVQIFLRLELVCRTMDFPVLDAIISEKADVAAGVCGDIVYEEKEWERA